MEIASRFCLLISINIVFFSGYYLYPTVFTNVEDHMFVAQEESFGPIMIISPFFGRFVSNVVIISAIVMVSLP